MVAVAYKRWSSGAHQNDGLLVVVYERLQLQGFDRKNFGVLDLFTLMEGGRLLEVVADGVSTAFVNLRKRFSNLSLWARLKLILILKRYEKIPIFFFTFIYYL